MSNTLRYNNTIPNNIYYGGSTVQNVYYNNTKVWSASRPFAFTYTGAYETEGNLEGNFIIRFKTSGTLTITSHGNNTNGLYDWFAVGGGGRGGRPSGSDGGGGMGGGGGYTSTVRGVAVPTSIQIVIGAGSSEYTTYNNLVSAGASYAAGVINANGGRSAFISACWRNSSSEDWAKYFASGGSGGGTGGYSLNATRGGSDGSDGVESGSSHPYLHDKLGGIGQGSTTREFGESTGKLYSGGGGGGAQATASSKPMPGGDGGGGAGALAPSNYASTYIASSPGEANTGGGGGGGAETLSSTNIIHGASGGSGIVCLRNAR